MSQKMNITRRDFLRLAGMSTLSAALAACGTKVVKETQIVQQTVAPQIIKETVAPQIIKQTVAPEVVQQTVVAKETVMVEVTSTPTPAVKEAPMLADMVAAGKLPPLDQRMPANPLVIPEISEVGQYGGLLRQYAPNTTTFHDLHWCRESNWVRLAQDTYFDKNSPNGVSMHRAESITANDTMTEFVVKLRQGIKWSDGQPVTADDVLFAVNDVWFNKDFAGIAWWQGWFKENPTVTKVDDFTIKYVFTSPATSFLTDLAGWGSNQGLGTAEVPSHYLKQFHATYNPDADKNAKAAKYDNWQKYYAAMAACGTDQINVDLPTINNWMLKTHTDTQNVYVRNPYYWAVDSAGNQLPYIDGFLIDAVSDIEVAKLKLIAGDFDLAGVFLIQLSEYPLLKKNEQKGKYLLVLNKGNATAKPEICPNLNHKDLVLRDLFQKPDFHKALSYAINRDEINQVAFAGLGTGMQNIYTVWDNVDPSQWATQYTEFNQDKAKGLLDGLGLKKDAKGNYLRPDGKALTLNLETIVEEGWANVVELVAKHWTDIGIPTQYSPIARDLWGQKDTSAANDLDFFIWHDYSYSERTANNSGAAFAGWALSEKAWYWYDWLVEKGQHPEELEPPEEWKTYYANVVALSKSKYGSDEYKTLAKQVWDFRITDQLYCIGTIGDYPTPLLIKTDIGNFGNNDIPFNYWQGQYPEQWYWKDPTRRGEAVP